MTRASFALTCALLSVAAPARAACDPSCFAGGGPAATDCFVQWQGASGPRLSCTDGDPSCDGDGTADGTCTFPLAGCLNVASAGCTPAALESTPVVKGRAPAGAALTAALSTLDLASPGCSTPGVTVAVVRTPTRLKPGVAKLVVSAVAGGKKDVDKLTLTCRPASPSFAALIQPFFTQNCAVPTCHTGFSPSSNLSLDSGESLAELINQRAAIGRQVLVKPGSIAKSKLVKNLLGRGASLMPQGCPTIPPEDVVCPDPQGPDIYRVMAWIQAGARDN